MKEYERGAGRRVGIVMTLALALAGATSAALAQSSNGDIRLRGYGDVRYAHYNYGADQRSGEDGAPADDRAVMDVQRFVLELTQDLSPNLGFEVEIEFEHGGTGSAMELEYEEFGEFENEVEKGGEIALEQLHLTRRIASGLNVRLGHFVVPVGDVNAHHLPQAYFGTARPEGETSLVPVVWHETGVEVFGELGEFRYRLQLVNGLDSTGFSSRDWIRGGHQGRFEEVNAANLAKVFRLEYRGVAGLVAGASFYRGETSGNRPKPDMEGIDAPVTIVTGEVRLDRGLWRGRATWLSGDLANADEVSRKNSRLSTNLGVPRTPVAARAQAWGVELGCNVLHWLAPGSRDALLPFARFERYDSMQSVDEGFFADPRFDRDVLTAGLNWEFSPKAVLKADWSLRSFGADRYRNEQTVGLALGWRIGA
jgi:hypothetical protein